MASHQWHKNLLDENPFRHVSEHDPSEVDSLAIQVTTIHSLTLAITTATRDKSLLCVWSEKHGIFCNHRRRSTILRRERTRRKLSLRSKALHQAFSPKLQTQIHKVYQKPLYLESWIEINENVPFGFRAGAVVAKYGDKSVYFDLEDLGNTTGQWDLYGSDAPSPYNPLQVFYLKP